MTAIESVGVSHAGRDIPAVEVAAARAAEDAARPADGSSHGIAISD